MDPQKLLLNEDKIPTTMEALKKYYDIEADIINNVLKERPDSRYKILLDDLQLSQIEEFRDLIKDSKIMGLCLRKSMNVLTHMMP